MSQMRKAEPQAQVNRLCFLLEIPISSCYYKPVQKRNQQKEAQIIRKLHIEHHGTYGKRRICKALEQKGIKMSISKTSKLMKTLGIIAKSPRKKHHYPIGFEKPTIKNHLNRAFNQPKVNTHWVGDMTYIRRKQGFSYLATVLDLGNREIVGWALSQTPDANLVKKALTNAICKHQPKTHKLLFHSDQGVQYCAQLFKETLSLHGITQSMSRRGNCYDNAVQERFFRSLKTEYLNEFNFTNHKEVIIASQYYINYYNRQRLNSAIGYKTPTQKRCELLANVA